MIDKDSEARWQRIESLLADNLRHSELQDREALRQAGQIQRLEAEIRQLRARLKQLEDGPPGASGHERPPHY